MEFQAGDFVDTSDSFYEIEIGTEDSDQIHLPSLETSIVVATQEANDRIESMLTNFDMMWFTTQKEISCLGCARTIPRNIMQKSATMRSMETHTAVEQQAFEYSWLQTGRLLRLKNPKSKSNLSLFQQQWARSKPVIISNCHKQLTLDLWTPQSFSKDFGHHEIDFIDCETSRPLSTQHKMQVFWDGFEHMACK